MGIEETDVKILEELQKNARVSYRELSELTGIPSSTLHDRVKKLTEEGVIERIVAILDDEAVGCTQVAQYDLMIKLRAYNRAHLGGVLNRIRNIKGVQDINVAVILEVFKESHTLPLMSEYIEGGRT